MEVLAHPNDVCSEGIVDEVHFDVLEAFEKLRVRSENLQLAIGWLRWDVFLLERRRQLVRDTTALNRTD